MNSNRISTSHAPAAPARDYFTWQSGPLNGPVSRYVLQDLVQQMIEDGVPEEAVIQINGPQLYAQWQRESW